MKINRHHVPQRRTVLRNAERTMANHVPEDPDTLLTRDETAVALTQAGFPVRSATLATKACRGGGPEFRLFGTRPLYRWGDALAWAQAKLTAPRRKADGCAA